MKFTYTMWFLTLVVAFFTAGFFPALLLGALAIAGSISTGLHAHELGSGSSYKALR